MTALKSLQVQVKRRNLLATLLIAIFVSISFFILINASHQQNKDYEVFNVASSQSMLSQNIAYFALQRHQAMITADKKDPSLVKDMQLAIERFSANHVLLSDLIRNKSAAVPQDLYSLYFNTPTQLDQKITDYINSAIELSQTSNIEVANKKILKTFNSDSIKELLTSLELVVTKVDQHTHERLAIFEFLEAGVWLTIMLLLFAISFFIFRPLQKLITYSENEVIQSKKKNSELTFAINKHAIVYRVDMDEQGTLTEVNQRFLDFYRYSEEEIKGRSVFDICGNKYTKEDFIDIFRHIVKNEYWHGESVNKIKGGRELSLSTTVIPLLNNEKRFESFIVIQNDISGIKQTELTLNQLHKITSDVNKSLNDKINDILVLGKEIFNLPLAIVSEIQEQDYRVAYCNTPNGEIKQNDVFELGNTYCFHTLKASQPVAFDHAGNSEIKDHPCYLGFGLESYIGAPLTVDGKRFGTLNFSGPEISLRPFTERELDIIQLFSHWIEAQLTRANHQERLAGQQLLMEQMAQQARIGAWEVDLVNNSIYWSSMTKEIHEVPDDYQPELSQAINFYKEGESRDKITALVEQSINDGTPYEQELQLVTAKGNEVWVSARGRAEFINDTCVRLYGSFQDISDKMASQEKIHQHNQRMALATDSSGIGIWSLDLITDELKWDHWMMKLHGINDEDFVGVYDTWKDLLHPDDADNVSNELSHAINAQEKFDSQYRIIWPNGAIKHIKASAIVSYDSAKNPIALVGVNYDVTESVENATELQLAKEHSEIAARAKNEFFASMSHEIRTPMNGVIGMLDLVKGSSLNQEQKHRINIAQQSAKSLLTLINDILDFSKIDANKLELENSRFNLPHMVGDLAESLAPQAQMKGVELIVDLVDIEQPYVIGDSNRIRQILTNLLANAIKFTKHGEVIISLKQQSESDSQWRIIASISDTGIGIPKGVRDTLFDVFTQVDASTTREYGGTGLGLAIVKKLCLCMNGNIKVESIEKQGSVFTCELLLDKSEEPLPKIPKEILVNKCVLIIENNTSCAEAIKQQLAKWHVNADIADSKQSAMLLINNEHGLAPYDLLIISDQLPATDISTFIKELRFNPKNENVSIALMTLMNKAGANVNLENSANITFPKPVIPKDLKRALNTTLDATNQFQLSRHIADKNKPLPEADSDWTSNVKLLLVEDNRVNQMVAIGVLNKIGISQCEVAVNGKDAIDKLNSCDKDKPFTFIFMDCQMPEMDGYEATRLIRKNGAGEQYQDIPIVAMTANAMPEDEEKCLSSGMNDYLVKPIDKNRVRETVKLFQQQTVVE